METLNDLLDQSAAKHGPRTALKIKLGFRIERWTYSFLQEHAGRVATYLVGEGIEKGDRVVLCAPNQPAWVGAFFACMKVGAVVVPLDLQSSPEFVSKVVTATEPKLIIGDRTTGGLLQDNGVPFLQFDELAERAKDCGQTPRSDVSPEDIAEIIFTSGTTGDPKGVVLTHQNIVSNVEAVADRIPGKPSYRFLSLLPLSHMLEQSAGHFLPLRAGACIVYPSSRQSGVIKRAIKQEKITTIVAVPQILTLLMNGIEREVERLGKNDRWNTAHALAGRLPMVLRRRLFAAVRRGLGSSLEFFPCGGSYLDPKLSQKWENLGIRVVQGYGATEASPFISCDSLKQRNLVAIGKPLPNQDVDIANDGEILVKGANVFQGYWRNPAATNAVLENGWYKTGDLGFIDDMGYLHFKGRKKNIIVLSDGRNVYPEDIEPVLNRELGTEGLEQAIIIGLAKNGRSTEVHAVLLSRDPAVVEAAIQRTNEQLTEYQRIRGFTVWPEEDFPRTRTLRVQRHLVTEGLEQDMTESTPPVPEPPAPVTEISGIRRVLAEVCSASAARIKDGDRLGEELGLDSLGLVELLSVIEAELGIFIDESLLAGDTTVAQLEELVVGQTEPVAGPELNRLPLSQPARLLRRAFHSVFVFPSLKVLTRPKVEGLENLEDVQGPVVFTANHSSHLDSVAVLYSLPSRLRRKTAVAAAEDYFFRRRILGAFTAAVINGFPFAREGGIRPSLQRCANLLDDGWSVLIFPEGTRSTTGQLGEFKSGTGLLAVEMGVPVVPIRLKGLHQVLPKGRAIPRPSKIEVHIGKPMYFPRGTCYSQAAGKIQKAVSEL